VSMLRFAIALVLLAFAFGGNGVKPSPHKYINLEGYNVLILTDTSVGSNQDAIWLKPDVSNWLESHANQYHIWDDSHTDFEYVDQAWQEGYQRAIQESEGTRPWILVSGRQQASQALPQDSSQVVKLLEACK